MSSIFALTVRQRICLYLVIGALAGLGCGGTSFDIDANTIEGDFVGPKNDAECQAAIILKCKEATFANGKCHAKGCTQPPDHPSVPIVNCPLGKTNNGVPWTTTACQAQATFAGCSSVTLYSFGCYGYTCTKLQCGK